ncbi:MAG: helix-turn-helix transcriptional regulator [Bdellovibrionaceae bacterium]|nr:helix-turn-helix transcriptional regulator [Pseudobdellovibrionaceae bacterium]
MKKNYSYEDVLKTIARNVKKLRKAKGLTQEDMVDFGFNYRHYQKIESGAYSPNLHTLVRLSQVFNITVDGLLKP